MQNTENGIEIQISLLDVRRNLQQHTDYDIQKYPKSTSM